MLVLIAAVVAFTVASTAGLAVAMVLPTAVALLINTPTHIHPLGGGEQCHSQKRCLGAGRTEQKNASEDARRHGKGEE